MNNEKENENNNTSDVEEQFEEEIENGRFEDRPGRSRVLILIAATAGAVLLVIVGAFLLLNRGATEVSQEKAAEQSETGTVKFLMEQQWLVKMKLAKVEEQTVSRQVTTTGRVIPAANSQAIVSTPVAGVLSDRQIPGIGQFISAGQPVAVIRQTATSVEQAQTRAAIAQAEAQRVQIEAQTSQINVENARLESEKRAAAGSVDLARVRLDAAIREADRMQRLFDGMAASQKQLQAAQSERQTAQAEYDASVKRRDALNNAKPISPPKIDAGMMSGFDRLSNTLIINAPFSGYVTKVNKSIGEQISPGDAILEISNLDTVYVAAPIFERDLYGIGTGSRTATFTTAAYPQEFKGTVVDFGATIDETTRAANVIFQVENAGRALRLGMQANVRLDGETVVTAMMIPKEAVLETEGKKIVYVLISGEEFQRREVTVGDEYGDRVAILSGIEAGERVVTQGAYQLRLQELRPADTGAHSHET